MSPYSYIKDTYLRNIKVLLQDKERLISKRKAKQSFKELKLMIIVITD